MVGWVGVIVGNIFGKMKLGRQKELDWFVGCASQARPRVGVDLAGWEDCMWHGMDL